MTTPLDTFETALLAELRDRVSTRGQAAAPIGGLRRRRWTSRLAVLAAGLAAATSALTVLPGLLAGPAYAVQAGPNGTIHVKIHRLEDAAGLTATLATYGVKADVRYLGRNTRCAAGRYSYATSVPGSNTRFVVGSRGISMDIDRRDIADGETVVIAASRITNGAYAEVGIAQGPVGPCEPVTT